MVHRSKHHAVYVKGVNDALAKHPHLDLDLVTLNKYAGTEKIPADIATAVRNHGALIGCASCIDCAECCWIHGHK